MRSSKPKRSRTGRPKGRKGYKKLSEIEQANRTRFHEEAWEQRVCAVCGKGGLYESHHVVEKKKLKAIFRADLLWDPRNCLRLCPTCHGAHTVGYRRVKLQVLRDENYEFAYEVLEAAAFYYLRDHYNGKDRRLSDGLTKWEARNDGEQPTATATGP